MTVVGEAANEDSTDSFVGNSGRSRSDPRAFFDPSDRTINRVGKLDAEPEPMALVPASGFCHLGIRLLTDPKRSFNACLDRS